MEPVTSNNSISARRLFNEVKSNLSPEETNEIRKKLSKKEAVYNFFLKSKKTV